MAEAKPVVLTQAATSTSQYDPEPLVIIGDIPVAAAQVTALTAVPGTFADLAAVQTYLDTLVTELKSSDYFS